MPDGTGERDSRPWGKRQSSCYLQVWIAFVYTWFHLKNNGKGLARSCPGDFCHLQFWTFTVIRNSEWHFFIPDFTLGELHKDALRKSHDADGYLQVWITLVYAWFNLGSAAFLRRKNHMMCCCTSWEWTGITGTEKSTYCGQIWSMKIANHYILCYLQCWFWILFMPESTEGVSEGQTTAMSGKKWWEYSSVL